MADMGPVEDSEFTAAVQEVFDGGCRDDVVRRPQYPADPGVVRVADTCLAIHAGPLLAIPGIGLKQSGRLAVERLLAGVAGSGLSPSHLTLDLTLPPEIPDEDIGRFMSGIDAAATDHGVSIVTGHTARYEGCAYPAVGAGTALALGEEAELVSAEGARPGDRVIISNGPALAATGVLGHLATTDLTAETAATARDRLAEATIVDAAQHVSTVEHVSAMAGAGDGGLDRCLAEIASVNDVGIAVDRDRIPHRPGVKALWNALSLNRWKASATGALIVTVEPAYVEEVVDRFLDAGVPAAAVGEVVDGSGVSANGAAVSSGTDPLWEAFGRYGVS
ncbi:MAG: AIR synthase-related protein [Salinirussus sp.]